MGDVIVCRLSADSAGAAAGASGVWDADGGWTAGAAGKEAAGGCAGMTVGTGTMGIVCAGA